MSYETEKIFNEFNKYLQNLPQENLTEEKINKEFRRFVNEYNNRTDVELTEKTAKTSDDFFELARNSDSEAQSLKYIKKALKLDPDNLDAQLHYCLITSKSAIDLHSKLKKAVEHGNEVMKKQGYMEEENIGHFWGMHQTRPYMRLRSEYIDSLIFNGMMREAIRECEDMIRLSENDNLGLRYRLMHLYAYFEDKDNVLNLYKKFEKELSSQMLMPISVLYFKLLDYNNAKKYLDTLVKENKDTIKYFKALKRHEMDKYFDEMNPDRYIARSIEEIIVTVDENNFLYDSTPGYFLWAIETLGV